MNNNNKAAGAADRAHRLVKEAVRTGRLIPQPCEKCGLAQTEAHHDDYSKPLDVRWLCRMHHAEADAMLRRGDAAELIGKSEIRARRQRLGLTRIRLAIAADCSTTHLANIEAGAVPSRSAALERVHAVLDRLEHDSNIATAA